MNAKNDHLDRLQSRLDREPSAPLSDEELVLLRDEIELAAQWDDLERMEDALRPTDAPEGLHDRIVARVAHEPIPTRPTHRSASRSFARFALVAAAILAVTVAGFHYEEEQSRRREGAAILASLPMPSLALPESQLTSTPITEVQAGTQPIRAFAKLGFKTAASPLRLMSEPEAE